MFPAKFWFLFLGLSLVHLGFLAGIAEEEMKFSPAQLAAIESVEQNTAAILDTNRKIWELAEVGLEEHQSAELLKTQLKQAGFEVKSGLADMPTAFVAEYG
jgi:aminobenzoyl-glutamate utilization protein B